MNIAIVLCGGVGKRMGAGKNKVLLEVGGKPLIFHTLKNFEDSKDIDAAVLVVGEKDQAVFSDMVKKYKLKKIMGIIPGGKERQDSGMNGLRFIDEAIENKKGLVVLFHNGANPFVSQGEIYESIREAKRNGASVVAHRTKDTIRRVDKKGFSRGVIDRSDLWNMQTPQTIRFELAKEAFERARKDKFLGTDDVSLVERLGKKVKIIEASDDNFKVTTPRDLELARIILKKK